MDRLSKSILQLIDQMEAEAKDLKDVGEPAGSYLHDSLMGWVIKLRKLLRESEGEGTVMTPPPYLITGEHDELK